MRLSEDDIGTVNFVCSRAIDAHESDLPRLILIHEEGIRQAQREIKQATRKLESAQRALAMREMALGLLVEAQQAREASA